MKVTITRADGSRFTVSLKTEELDAILTHAARVHEADVMRTGPDMTDDLCGALLGLDNVLGDTLIPANM